MYSIIGVVLIAIAIAFGVTSLWSERSHPVARPAGITQHATPAEYEHAAESYEDQYEVERHNLYYPLIADYLNGLPAQAKLLDLGCGNAAFLSRFRGRGWTLVGVDYSNSAVDLARKHFPDIAFVAADATEDLSAIGYGTFDAIISSEVIEHIILPRKYIANCYRLLKPGGVLVLTTPYHGYLKDLSVALTGRSHSHIRSPLWDYGHVKFWSVDTLSQVLFEVGFAQGEWRGAGRCCYLWKGMMLKAQVPPRLPA